MYYSFNLQLDLYDNNGAHVLSNDVTGKDLSEIKATVAACRYSITAGAITATYEGNDLDGISLASLNKMVNSDFVNFILGTEKEAQAIEYQQFQADC